MESELEWNAPTETASIRGKRRWRRPEVIAAIVLVVGGPLAVFEVRGLCWEGLLGSLVIFAIALVLVRPPLSLWLAAVLAVGACGSVGLMVWSGWRFHNLNVFSSYSPRLTYCDRDYQPSGPSRGSLSAFQDVTQHVLGVTPSGSAIIGTGCQTTILFIESPGPTYRPYDLLGGP
jgi:hypothetical protein